MRVTETASQCGVAADQALIGEGFMREDRYYRLLAMRLGAPYYCGELKLAECPNPSETAARGIAWLAPNALGLRCVLAPRGEALALMLGAAAGRLRAPFAITSPQRLRAVIRFQMRQQVAEDAANALVRADSALSAAAGPSNIQRVCTQLSALGALSFGIFCPEDAQIACAMVLWTIFASTVVLRFAAVAARRSSEAISPLGLCQLPLYSIIAPLYRETKIAPQLIKALDAIDYPKSKLDIKLVVEDHDRETLTALARMFLPSRYDIVVAPAGAPTTKPRALNVALSSARGDLVVVYDAEDIPDPDQLRRAAARFAEDPRLSCLQARLAVYNPDDSWLSNGIM